MDGQQIYDNFHSHATGTGGLQDSQDGAQTVSRSFQERADDVQRLMDAVGQGWQGVAADQAATAMTPLAVNFNEAGDDLGKAQDLISRQTESFHLAASKVQPMPPRPQLQDPLVALTSGQNLDPYLNQLGRYSAAANNNVDAMNVYHGASTYNTSALPPVTPDLPSASAPVDLQPNRPFQPTGATGHSGTSPSSARPNTSGARTAGGIAAGQSPGAARSATVPTNAAVAATGPNSIAGAPAGGLGSAPGTRPSAQGDLSTDHPVPRPGIASPAFDTPVGNTGSAADGLGVGLPGGGGLGADAPGRGRAGGGLTGGGEEGEGGFGRGVRGGGVRGGGMRSVGEPRGAVPGRAVPGGGEPGGGQRGGGQRGGEPRGGQRGGGEPGLGGEGDGAGARSGARGGAGASGFLTEEEALAGRGAAGKPGMSGLPGMMGAHGGRDAEDAEHRRKYPYGEDPEEIFAGDLPLVAPPTIGEQR